MDLSTVHDQNNVWTFHFAINSTLLKYLSMPFSPHIWYVAVQYPESTQPSETLKVLRKFSNYVNAPTLRDSSHVEGLNVRISVVQQYKSKF
jgi:hypothetical protein